MRTTYTPYKAFDASTVDSVSLDPEIQTAEYVPEGDALRRYVQDVKRHSLLSIEEEREVARRVRVFKDEMARQRLIEANLRFVITVARRMRGRTRLLTLLDLIQAGNIGLMRATEDYDETRGHRFLTYAGWWISQAIIREIAISGRLIRYPVHATELLSKVNKARVVLEKQLGRNPTDAEIATYINEPFKNVARIIFWGEASDSLDDPLYENEPNKRTLADFFGDQYSFSPEQILRAQRALRSFSQQIIQVLRHLIGVTGRDREVFLQRYGIGFNLEPKTLEQVGKIHGVSRERIRQIIAKIWKDLRECGVEVDDAWMSESIERIKLLEDIAGEFSELSAFVEPEKPEALHTFLAQVDSDVADGESDESNDDVEEVAEPTVIDRAVLEDELARIQRKLRLLRSALKILSDEDTRIFKERYGLSNESRLDQLVAVDVCASKLGVTVSRANRSISAVWKKLKNAEVPVDEKWLVHTAPYMIELEQKLRES